MKFHGFSWTSRSRSRSRSSYRSSPVALGRSFECNSRWYSLHTDWISGYDTGKFVPWRPHNTSFIAPRRTCASAGELLTYLPGPTRSLRISISISYFKGDSVTLAFVKLCSGIMRHDPDSWCDSFTTLKSMRIGIPGTSNDVRFKYRNVFLSRSHFDFGAMLDTSGDSYRSRRSFWRLTLKLKSSNRMGWTLVPALPVPIHTSSFLLNVVWSRFSSFVLQYSWIFASPFTSTRMSDRLSAPVPSPPPPPPLHWMRKW